MSTPANGSSIPIDPSNDSSVPGIGLELADDKEKKGGQAQAPAPAPKPKPTLSADLAAQVAALAETGGSDATACPELCAFLVSSCPPSAGTSRSCCIALDRGAGKSNAGARIAKVSSWVTTLARPRRAKVQSSNLDNKIGFSPALETVWQGKISSGKYLNLDDATDEGKNPRGKKHQGICSEDKVVND
ncbi:MAG: hypothetical protein J0M12_15180, partial [Deltaproteobacteria bacterium]|nr:hypothetical protein [Deltaproteobacteria bacterium]